MTIELDVVTRLNERSALSAARQAHSHWDRESRTTGDAVQRNLGAGFDRAARNAERSAVQMERSFNRVADASGRVRLEQERYDALIQSGETDRVKLIRQSERLATARRNEENATRVAATVHRDYDRSIRDLGEAFTTPVRNAGLLSGTLTELGTTMTRLGPVAMATGIVGLGGALVQLGAIAASAAQSLWLLPGALGAVGTAFGTIKLATLGLDDAFENIGDPQKFIESLQELAPSAQQFMFAVRSMMPALTELQRATQGEFFDGFGQQANRLVTQFLPTIRAATTDVASSLNQMVAGVADQLMTPQTQQAIQTFLNNVSMAFQQLAPAAAPLTQALGDIMAVGSGVLPQLAQAATNAANAFATFISEARQSGDLQRWLTEGLDTLQDLVAIAWGFGEALMSLAPTARDILPTIRTLLQDIETIMPAIGFAANLVGMPIGLWVVAIDNAARAFEGIKTVVENVANAVIPIINRIGSALDAALAPIRAGIDAANAVNPLGDPIPQIPSYTPINQLGGGGQPTQGGLPGASAERRGGAPFQLPQQGSMPGEFVNTTGSIRSWWDVAGVPGLRAGDREAHQERMRELLSEQGRVGSLPDAPSLPLEYSSTAGMDASLAAAQNRVDETRHAVAERQARLNQLLAANVEDENAIQDARNALERAKQDQSEAEMRFAEAQQRAAEGQTKSLKGLTGGLNDLGAALDADLGISGGLSGMADNFVRLLGAIALAGPMAQMSAISQARGDEGSGLMGILASTGALGERFLPQPDASTVGSTMPSYGGNTGDPNADAMIALAQRSSGGKYSFGASDLAKGLSDCSGAVSDLVELITQGEAGPGRLFSTANAASVLQSLGAVPGLVPGALQIGFKNGGPGGGHMAATLPNGVNFESGGGTGQGATYGGAAVGANDPQFTDHWSLPVGPGTRLGAYTGGGVPFAGASPSLPSSSSGPTPVFVVNMPGGGFGAPASLPIGGPNPSTPGGPTPSSIGPAPLGGGVGAPLGTPGSGIGLGPAPGPAGAPAGPGLPLPPLGGVPGGGGSTLPGTGMPGAAPLSTGGTAYPATAGNGGNMFGGLPMDAAMMATTGLDALAPGAGAAAKIGIQLANRTIGYLGQVAGIGVSGLMETLSLGDNPMGSLGKSWFGRIAGGFASARPALPNIAGQSAPATPSDKDPRQGAQAGLTAAKGGDTNINITQASPTDEGTGRTVAWHMNAPAGRQG